MSKQRIVSGQLGNHKYEFECLIPGTDAAVVVQLREESAQRLVWWHRPEYAGMPFREVPELDDDDELCEAIEAAVQGWVATFPLIAESAIPQIGDDRVVAEVESEIRGLGWVPSIAPEFDGFMGCVPARAWKAGRTFAITVPGDPDIVIASGQTRRDAAWNLLAKVRRAQP